MEHKKNKFGTTLIFYSVYHIPGHLILVNLQPLVSPQALSLH